MKVGDPSLCTLKEILMSVGGLLAYHKRRDAISLEVSIGARGAAPKLTKLFGPQPKPIEAGNFRRHGKTQVRLTTQPFSGDGRPGRMVNPYHGVGSEEVPAQPAPSRPSWAPSGG